MIEKIKKGNKFWRVNEIIAAKINPIHNSALLCSLPRIKYKLQTIKKAVTTSVIALL